MTDKVAIRMILIGVLRDLGPDATNGQIMAEAERRGHRPSLPTVRFYYRREFGVAKRPGRPRKT